MTTYDTEGVAFPNFNETIGAISTQIKERKTAVLGRTLIVSLPGIIFVSLYFLFLRLEIKDSTLFTKIWIYLYIAFPFVFAYTLIFAHLFSIEKHIWIDSFFDRQNLDTKKSMRIAKRLFIQTLIARLQLFCRYYLLPCVTTLVSLSYVFYVTWRLTPMSNVGTSIPPNFNINWTLFLVSGGLGLTTAILSWFYFYYLRIKLRFFWPLFLDHYGKGKFSFRLIVAEMIKFNMVHKNEAFKQLLAIHIGTDTAQAVVTSVGAGFLGVIANKNKYVEAVAIAGTLIVSEMAHQFASLSKITANYMIYRYIRYFYYQNTQEVNENMYKV